MKLIKNFFVILISFLTFITSFNIDVFASGKSLLNDDMSIIEEGKLAEQRAVIPNTSSSNIKVTFKLKDDQSHVDGISKIDGGEEIIKYLPLNKRNKNDAEYKANGFYEDNLGENIKLGTTQIEQVIQTLNDGSRVTREVLNCLDENGKPYTGDDLIARQFPTPYEIDSKGARIIGWVTVPYDNGSYKIEGEPGTSEGRVRSNIGTLTYYNLLKDRGRVIRSLDDWKKADEDMKKEKLVNAWSESAGNTTMVNNIRGYIVDQYSPIDKDRTLYPIYLKGSVVLHSGVYNNDSEITHVIDLKSDGAAVRRYLSIKDVSKRRTYAIANRFGDARNHVNELLVNIPKAPYLGDKNKIDAEIKAQEEFEEQKKSNRKLKRENLFDPELKDFYKEGYTFVGWREISERELKDVNGNPLTGQARKNRIDKILNEEFIAGKNNDRINEIKESEDGKEGDGASFESKYRNVEKLKNLRNDTFMPDDEYLKNEFSMYYKERKCPIDLEKWLKAHPELNGENDPKKAFKDFMKNQKFYFEDGGFNGEFKSDECVNKNTYLPNGYSLLMHLKDFRDNRNIKTIYDVCENEVINLYAVYRPYYEVNVTPRYMNINRTAIDAEHQYGKYENLKDEYNDAKKDLDIGLLTRTAVTDYTKPTVAASANYNPITNIISSTETAIKQWSKDSNEPLRWKVPGFDELGRRKSYVSVIVDDSNRSDYNNFGTEFNEEMWKKFDIFTYLKWIGNADKDAPKNLHENLEHADPYGIAMSKIQNFLGNKRIVTVDGKTEEKIDVFTSATQRQAILMNNAEVKGYNIIMTNSPGIVPKPVFDTIRDRDNVISLGFPSKGYAQRDYKDITKINLEIKKISLEGSGSNLNEEILKSFELIRNKNDSNKFTGTSVKSDNFTIEGTIEDGRLNLSIKNADGEVINFKDYKDDYVKVTYKHTYLEDGEEKELLSTNTEHIVPVKTSKAIKEMSQVEVKVDNPNPVKIKFKVPEALLDQVTKGSKYKAEKWDADAQKWTKVGEKILEETDLINNQFQGNEYEISLNNVNQGDKVRIVSLEKNSLAEGKNGGTFYTKEERENGAEDGYSLPNYSTRIIENGVDEPNINEAPAEGGEGTQYISVEYNILEGSKFPNNPNEEKYVKLKLNPNGGNTTGGENYYWVKKDITVTNIKEKASGDGYFKFWGEAKDANKNAFPIEIKNKDIELFAIYGNLKEEEPKVLPKEEPKVLPKGEETFEFEFENHDEFPTTPVFAKIPDKTKKYDNKLYFIFTIDKKFYKEIRNGETFNHRMDVAPIIKNDRTMMPLRYVGEAIGADVSWNNKTRTASFTKNGITASIQIDSDKIILSNGKEYKMDSKPLIKNDRILVSLTNVSKVFGLTNGNLKDGIDNDIEWDEHSREIIIYLNR